MSLFRSGIVKQELWRLMNELSVPSDQKCGNSVSVCQWGLQNDSCDVSWLKYLFCATRHFATKFQFCIGGCKPITVKSYTHNSRKPRLCPPDICQQCPNLAVCIAKQNLWPPTWSGNPRQIHECDICYLGYPADDANHWLWRHTHTQVDMCKCFRYMCLFWRLRDAITTLPLTWFFKIYSL